MDVNKVLHIDDNNYIYIVDHQSHYGDVMVDVTHKVFDPTNVRNVMENFFQTEFGVSFDEMRELIEYIKIKRRPQDFI
jgi:hypothetical protein